MNQCFEMYDLNNDGILTKEEMLSVFKFLTGLDAADWHFGQPFFSRISEIKGSNRNTFFLKLVTFLLLDKYWDFGPYFLKILGHVY